MDDAIDLRLFRYALALGQTLHFGRAAQQLHMTQPPLTRQIRQLEELLGVRLFERGRSGVALTPAGAAFLPAARAALEQARKAIVVARAAHDGARGQFVIGYSTVFDRSAAPDVAASLQEAFPGWAIRSKGRHSVNLVRELNNGQLDVALIGLHTAAPDLSVEPLHQEPPLVALPSAHRLAKKRALAATDLADETLFWFERRLNPGYHDYARAVFERIGFVPAMLLEPPDHHQLLAQIAEGQGVALIPASLAQLRRKGVVLRPLKGPLAALSMGLAVAYRPDNASPVLAAYLALLRSAAPAHAPKSEISAK